MIIHFRSLVCCGQHTQDNTHIGPLSEPPSTHIVVCRSIAQCRMVPQATRLRCPQDGLRQLHHTSLKTQQIGQPWSGGYLLSPQSFIQRCPTLTKKSPVHIVFKSRDEPKVGGGWCGRKDLGYR